MKSNETHATLKGFARLFRVHHLASFSFHSWASHNNALFDNANTNLNIMSMIMTKHKRRRCKGKEPRGELVPRRGDVRQVQQSHAQQ